MRDTGDVSVASSTAQAALQGLANQLRDLRIDAGLSGIELAAEAGWHRTKVSHIEHARRAPSADDVRSWCRACGADDRAGDLVAALRQVEDAYVQWRRLQQTGLRHLQESYLPLYERTETQRVYSATVIPGLLQTSAYATALFSQITDHSGTPDDVDEAVEVRMRRRRVLRSGCRFAFLLEEAVLTYGLGGSDVMAAQLRQLVKDMTLPSVGLGIIPVTADRSRWPLETFTIFDDTRARVELLAARVTVTAPSEVSQYSTAFQRLAGMAMYGPQARRIIRAHLNRLDT